MAILPDNINDKEENLKKRVDVLYNYIEYMRENLEFWGSNRTKDINSITGINSKTFPDCITDTDGMYALADLPSSTKIIGTACEGYITFAALSRDTWQVLVKNLDMTSATATQVGDITIYYL